MEAREACAARRGNLSWFTILGIAFGLAMDALAVAVVVGLAVPAITVRHWFRLAFHFGLFQFFMPILGWAAGDHFGAFLIHWDHWIALALLSGVGGKMIWESRHPEGIVGCHDPTRGWSLLGLSLATSIDALAVGFSLGLLTTEILTSSIIIGLVAAACTTFGLLAGKRLGPVFGARAALCGGIILLVIGVRILIWDLINHHF